MFSVPKNKEFEESMWHIDTDPFPLALYSLFTMLLNNSVALSPNLIFLEIH